ncbi:MAG TPA: metallophosphoesterase [Candidatus Nanoarchaeia archaeon]|nr:metallophosphoesterase [Candidatus Nanoarchaeia archaeon]
MKYLAFGCSHGKLPKIKTKDFDAIFYLGDIVGYEKKKELQSGRKVAKYLNSLNKKTYIIPGNWDSYKTRFWNVKKNHYKDYIIKNLKNLKDLHLKSVENKEHVIIGYGIYEHPEIWDDELYWHHIKKLSRLFRKAKRKKKLIIFITHNQPYNTKFSYIRDKKSFLEGIQVGSNVIKDIIKEFKPALCIGAHMHEHFGKLKVGKTLCIATGYGLKGKKVLINVDKKIRSIKFIRK